MIFNLTETNITSGSGGGGGGNEDAIIDKTISVYENNTVQTVSNFAFAYCNYLTSVNFTNVESIGGSAFLFCPNLRSISFPKALEIETQAFNYCSALT